MDLRLLTLPPWARMRAKRNPPLQIRIHDTAPGSQIRDTPVAQSACCTSRHGKVVAAVAVAKQCVASVQAKNLEKILWSVAVEATAKS